MGRAHRRERERGAKKNDVLQEIERVEIEGPVWSESHAHGSEEQSSNGVRSSLQGQRGQALSSTLHDTARRSWWKKLADPLVPDPLVLVGPPGLPEALGERGVELDEKTVRSLALSVGSKALAQREARVHAARQGIVLSDEYVGKRYHAFQWRKIPIGSGAVESAIRRVINLRLKGPSIFWREENAERKLHLRAYLKAGRWDELMRSVIQPAYLADAVRQEAA